MSTPAQAIREARDLLLSLRGQGDRARAEFRWPEISGPFNWAVDWFDDLGRGNQDTALWLRDEDGSDERYSYDEMVHRSDRLAAWLDSTTPDRPTVSVDGQVYEPGPDLRFTEPAAAASYVDAVLSRLRETGKDYDGREQQPVAATVEFKRLVTHG